MQITRKPKKERTIYFPRQAETQDVRVVEVSYMKTGYYLIILTILLTFTSLAGQMYAYSTGERTYLVDLFDLDKEANVPTFFSTLLLLLSSVLFLFIFYMKKSMNDKFKYHWLIISTCFFYMSMDENIRLHEQLSPLLRGRTKIHFAWVIPGAISVLVFLISYLKFYLRFKNKYRFLFGISALIYFGGSLGMELLGSIYQSNYGQNNFGYSMFTHFEEFLEMGGLVLLIHSLATYMGESGHRFQMVFPGKQIEVLR